MPKPSSPSDHYQAAERLLRATAETPENSATLAVAHAVLCLAGRRARKVRQPRHSPGNGLPPHLGWGDDSD
jgi:hypothetical protein